MNKRLALLMALAAVALSTPGCMRRDDPPAQGDTSQAPRGPALTPEDDRGSIWVWKDPDTGCEYLVLYTKAITPRMEDQGGKSGLPNPQRGCHYER